MDNMAKETNKQMIVRWLFSTGVTFLTGFVLFLAADSVVDSITLESFRDGTFLGILFAASRAGVKAVVEMGAIYLPRLTKHLGL